MGPFSQFPFQTLLAISLLQTVPKPDSTEGRRIVVDISLPDRNATDRSGPGRLTTLFRGHDRASSLKCNQVRNFGTHNFTGARLTLRTHLNITIMEISAC